MILTKPTKQDATVRFLSALSRMPSEGLKELMRCVIIMFFKILADQLDFIQCNCNNLTKLLML